MRQERILLQGSLRQMGHNLEDALPENAQPTIQACKVMFTPMNFWSTSSALFPPRLPIWSFHSVQFQQNSTSSTYCHENLQRKHNPSSVGKRHMIIRHLEPRRTYARKEVRLKHRHGSNPWDAGLSANKLKKDTYNHWQIDLVHYLLRSQPARQYSLTINLSPSFLWKNELAWWTSRDFTVLFVQDLVWNNYIWKFWNPFATLLMFRRSCAIRLC